MTNPFATKQQMEDAERRGVTIRKEYNATVWARDGEELTFHVKFGAGSHIGVNWDAIQLIPNKLFIRIFNRVFNTNTIINYRVTGYRVALFR